MDLQLAGRRALVTGGTRGIGRAVVEGFAAEGTTVAFCARTFDQVTAAEQDLKDRGVQALGRALDVADAAALVDWVRAAGDAFGGIDIVVANVSAMAVPSTEDNWAASFTVDLMGTVRLVNAALPYLERSEAAAIVTISSVSGREIDFAAGPYGTCKAALVHYTCGLAHQLAPKGIRANTVSPGNTFEQGGPWDGIRQHNPSLYDDALALNPTGCMGTPAEVANAVVFLASPAASRISGTNLIVDGALTRGVQL